MASFWLLIIGVYRFTLRLQSSSFWGSILESLTKKRGTPKKELLWSLRVDIGEVGSNVSHANNDPKPSLGPLPKQVLAMFDLAREYMGLGFRV